MTTTLNVIGLGLGLALGLGCRSDPPRPTVSAPSAKDANATAAAAAAEPGGCTLDDVAWRRPAAARVIAIGDLHGDLAATRAALRAATVIDGGDRWIGGKTVVVQTGDVLDRGDDEQAIVDLLERLEREAAAAGGAVIWLLGNHELMNAAGDLRYVTPGGFRDFDDVAGLDTSGLGDVPADRRARVAAFRPGGPYARIMAGQNAIAIVGDAVFSHAGVVGPWAGQVDDVNRESRCWLSAQSPPAAPAVLSADDSPVWTRIYGVDPVDCNAARGALAALGARRMVVGHTPQPNGISSACDATVWRIDVGLAAHYGGPIQVLEFVDGKPPAVLTGTRP